VTENAEVDGSVRCWNCKGSGSVGSVVMSGPITTTYSWLTCPSCQGKGKLKLIMEECPRCHGSGVDELWDCAACDGLTFKTRWA